MRTSCARGVKRAANSTSTIEADVRQQQAAGAAGEREEQALGGQLPQQAPRLAPSAVRSASSRSRRIVRATARLATLAQTMSRTKPAVLTRMRSVGSKLRVNSRRSGVPRRAR